MNLRPHPALNCDNRSVSHLAKVPEAFVAKPLTRKMPKLKVWRDASRATTKSGAKGRVAKRATAEFDSTHGGERATGRCHQVTSAEEPRHSQGERCTSVDLSQ
jgi:hypothetical protein